MAEARVAGIRKSREGDRDSEIAGWRKLQDGGLGFGNHRMAEVTMARMGVYIQTWVMRMVRKRRTRKIRTRSSCWVSLQATLLNLAHSLPAIDALQLDYTVKFPLSLVISRKTILRYQLLFRFLLHLRHVEQSLSSMWMDHKSPTWRTAVPYHTEFEQWRNRVFLLRARMLAFVQQILAFVTFEVLEPNWRKLEAKLGKVHTVDGLLRDHVDFLDTCLKECMLTSNKLLRVSANSYFRHICPSTPPTSSLRGKG